jgi:hypothetical protein
MNSFIEATMCAFVAAVFVVGCGKKTTDEEDPFANQLTGYSFSAFSNLQTFQGTMVAKYVSSFPSKSS